MLIWEETEECVSVTEVPLALVMQKVTGFVSGHTKPLPFLTHHPQIAISLIPCRTFNLCAERGLQFFDLLSSVPL